MAPPTSAPRFVFRLACRISAEITVVAGRRADLVLLNHNPLENVSHVADRVGVMARGQRIPESEIQKRLDQIARRFGN